MLSLSSDQAVVNKIVAKHGGLMTVEYVAEGFYSLLTDCPRGSVLGAVNKFPYFIIPDTSETMVAFNQVIFTKYLSGEDAYHDGDPHEQADWSNHHPGEPCPNPSI